jgi:plastocyanin
MSGRIIRAVAFLLMALVVAPPVPALAGGGHFCPADLPATEPGQVVILDNCFVPEGLTVQAGETVRWDYRGTAAHTVTFDTFDAGEVRGSFSARFNIPGVYYYRCKYHPAMTGAVTVEGVAQPGSAIVPLSEVKPVAETQTAALTIPGGQVTRQAAGPQEVNVRIRIEPWTAVALAVIALSLGLGATIALRLGRS